MALPMLREQPSVQLWLPDREATHPTCACLLWPDAEAVWLQVAERTYTLPDGAFGFPHDMLVTDNYYIIVENPTRMDFWKFLTKYTVGQACLAECMVMDPTRPMKVCSTTLLAAQLKPWSACGGTPPMGAPPGPLRCAE